MGLVSSIQMVTRIEAVRVSGRRSIYARGIFICWGPQSRRPILQICHAHACLNVFRMYAYLVLKLCGPRTAQALCCSVLSRTLEIPQEESIKMLQTSIHHATVLRKLLRSGTQLRGRAVILEDD